MNESQNLPNPRRASWWRWRKTEEDEFLKQGMITWEQSDPWANKWWIRRGWWFLCRRNPPCDYWIVWVDVVAVAWIWASMASSCCFELQLCFSISPARSSMTLPLPTFCFCNIWNFQTRLWGRFIYKGRGGTWNILHTPHRFLYMLFNLFLFLFISFYLTFIVLVNQYFLFHISNQTLIVMIYEKYSKFLIN